VRYVPDYNAITAWATLAAVLVALFLQPLQRWWRAPKLRLGIRKRDASRERIDSGFKALPRFYVYNDGRGVAEKLRVTLTSIFVRSNETYQIADEPISTDLLWTDFQTYCLEILAGKTARFADLGEVTKLNIGNNEAKHFLVIRALHHQHQLIEGDYVLRVVISGANFRARTYLVEVGVGPRPVPNERFWFSLRWPDKQIVKAITRLEREARFHASLR